MNDAEKRLSYVDLATIELMRADPSYDRYCEGVDDHVDTAITAQFAKGADEPKLAQNPWMPRLIAQRAKLYCEEVLAIPVSRHVEKLQQLRSLLILIGVVVLALLLLGFIGARSWFFDEQKNANISWLLWLMLFMCTTWVVSLATLISMAIRGFRRKNAHEAPKPTWVLWLVWGVVDAVQPLINMIPKTRSDSFRDALEKLKAISYRQSHLASAVSLLVINAFTLCATIVVWGSLWIYLSTNNVGYVYHNSLSSPEERAESIDLIDAPAEFLGYQAPSVDAIRWAEGSYQFDESDFVTVNSQGFMQEALRRLHILLFSENPDVPAFIDKAVISTPWTQNQIDLYKTRKLGDFRRQWSQFLFGSVIAYLVVPRLVICVASGIYAWWTTRSLLPNAKDDHVRKIVNQVINSSDVSVSHSETSENLLKTSTQISEPKSVIEASSSKPPATSLPTQQDLSPSDSQPSLDSQPARVVEAVSTPQPTAMPTPTQVVREPVTPAIDHSQSAPKPPQILSLLRLVGYELEDDSYQRLPVLSQRLKNAEVDRNLNGAREQMSYIGELHSDDRVVIVASLLTTADDAFREFVEDVGTAASVRVVLTDGTAAREECQETSSTYDFSLQAWKKMIRKAGVAGADILAHDLCNDQGISLAAAALDQRDHAPDESSLRIVGRFDAGIQVIRRHAEFLMSTNPLSEAVVLQNMDEDLSKLYASEKQSLMDRLQQARPSQQIQDKLSKLQLPSEIPKQCAQAASIACGGLLNRLPTRWAMAGGLSGLAVGTVGGLAAVASGGTAILPMLMPIIVGHTVSGAGIGGGFKLWLDRKAKPKELPEPVEDNESNDVTIARCGVIQIMLYELQGNAESMISEQVSQVTNRLDQISPQTMERLLEQFATEMHEMEGQR